MAASSVTERRAIWLVWSRQLLARYAFWLQLVGLDSRDRSWAHRFYLVYLVLFMAGWAFAMMALLAHGTAQLLQFLAPASPDTSALLLLTIALSGWVLYELYRSSRRSPFVFSPEDALLLCQTPASRQVIALAWFAARWLEVALPCGLAVLVLESGVVGLTVGSQLQASDLHRYALAGLRGLSLVIPWQTAMLALVWAAGAHRLQGDRDRPAWRWAAPLAALLLGAGIVWSRHNSAVRWLGSRLLWPLVVPLRAAFGQAAWLPAMLVALVLAALGLGALVVAAARLNLSRAAQETGSLAAQQRAHRGGAAALAHDMARRDRLGSAHASATWPIGPGVPAVMWKAVVQSTRGLTFESFGPWLLMLFAGLGVVLAPDWGARVVSAAFWILMIGQQSTARLKSDLSRWWLWQQLPLPGARLLLAEIAPAASASVVVTWLGLAIGCALAGHGITPAVWLVPTAVASIACAAVLAVLRQCHHDTLLAEQVPDAGELAFVLGLLCIAAPFGIAALFARQQWPMWAGIGLALLMSLACIIGLWRLALKTYSRIG